MSRVVTVTHGYPSVVRPNDCPFVKELMEVWHGMGVELLVVKPVVLQEYIRLLIKGKTKEEYVRYPLYFDFTFLRAFRKLPAIRRFHIKIADKSFQRSVERIAKIGSEDILYSHFLDSGFCVAALSKKYNIPAYCAVGESTLWTLEFKDMSEVRSRLNHINGFIAVSSKNKTMLMDENLASEDKIKVIPNGVNLKKIHQLDKNACRKELNIEQDKVVGVFLGHFIERKGPLRVAEATDGIENLQMMYIGAGEQDPQGNNIIFKGRVPHEEIPKYLSAADFFILPTQAEGCCNAIIEAMACGLPIISSDRDFNNDILDDGCSIRINPNDIEKIREAVKSLILDDSLRTKMSHRAKERAAELDINERAQNILQIMKYGK